MTTDLRPAEPWAPPQFWAPVAHEPRWTWAADGRVLLRTLAVLGPAGAAVGLLWAELAPKLALRPVLAGAEAPYRAQIGADAWFLFLTAAAGLVTAAVLLALRRDGPGVVLGLALGGVTAAVVADRIGYLAQRGATLHGLRALGVPPGDVNLAIIDFRVHALGVLVAWPLASVAVYWLALALRAPARHLP